MRSDQQVFTVFGGSFVGESHSHQGTPRARKQAGPMAAILVALVLGTATTAGAVTATQRVHASGYGFTHSSIIGVPTFQTASY